MRLTYIRRGKNRIPAIDLGGGLLKPVPHCGHAIVACAREAELDETLGLLNKPIERVTIRHSACGGACISGGTALRVEAERSRPKLWHIDNMVYDRRERRDTGWKSHRDTQYKQA